MSAADLTLEEYLARVLEAANGRPEKAPSLAAALRERDAGIDSPVDLWLAGLSLVRISACSFQLYLMHSGQADWNALGVSITARGLFQRVASDARSEPIPRDRLASLSVASYLHLRQNEEDGVKLVILDEEIPNAAALARIPHADVSSRLQRPHFNLMA